MHGDLHGNAYGNPRGKPRGTWHGKRLAAGAALAAAALAAVLAVAPGATAASTGTAGPRHATQSAGNPAARTAARTGAARTAAARTAGAQPAEQSADVVVADYTVQPDPGAMDNPSLTLNELLSQHVTRNVAPPCDDCQITSVVPDLTDPDGKSLNVDDGVMLHHVVLYQQGGQDVSCPGPFTPAFQGRRLFASGNERTTIPHVPGYGLDVPAGAQFASLADVMDFGTQPVRVQVRMHVTWVPGHSLKPITPVWLDETGCGLLPPSYMSVPAGPSEQSTTWRSTISGQIIGMGGHLHAWGQHIEAIDRTTRTALCDSRATQMTMGGMPMISDMSKCIGPAPDYHLAPIHKGDVIRMNSYYDAPQAEFLGAMGIMIMYVHES
jgi:hypothetical protein